MSKASLKKECKGQIRPISRFVHIILAKYRHVTLPIFFGNPIFDFSAQSSDFWCEKIQNLENI